MKHYPKKVALKLMGFTKSRFQYRIIQDLVCTGSPIEQCVKRTPQQLTGKEVNIIRKLFANPDYFCWATSSLYFHGVRNLELKIGLSTFYKYAKLLGLYRKWRIPKDDKKGIQTNAPNQFLHVDTTYYRRLESGEKAAVVFVSDNHSRFIMGHTVSNRNSSINVHDALQQAVQCIAKHHPSHNCLTKLVADGGSENHAQSITDLLRTCKKPPIQKVIARKDIEFSNSPVEAVNKIFKRYLRYYKPKTLEELRAVTALFVLDYNTIRPHGSLKGLTPFESYTNQPQLEFKTLFINAKTDRITHNKSNSCGLAC